jgi:hypothetical protein
MPDSVTGEEKAQEKADAPESVQAGTVDCGLFTMPGKKGCE